MRTQALAIAIGYRAASLIVKMRRVAETLSAQCTRLVACAVTATRNATSVIFDVAAGEALLPSTELPILWVN
eukprot:795791-Pleurochrysis_carterae.AAC.1